MDISFDEILKRNDDIIIDIRSISDYRNGHITGAISIPEVELVREPSKYLEKYKTYYLYCNYGNRSRIVSNYLNQLGYHTVNILGGYHNYLLI